MKGFLFAFTLTFVLASAPVLGQDFYKGTTTVVVQPCGSITEDPQGYCHGRLAHRLDFSGATDEAKRYAMANCVRQQRIRSGR